MRPLSGLSWPGTLFVLASIAAGIGVVPLANAWPLGQLHADHLLQLVYLGIATQVAALVPIRWGRSLHTVYTASLIAAGILSPGSGVALLVWLCTFDGRIPGRDIALWRFLFNRANLALAHGIPSLAYAYLPLAWASEPFALPVRTLLYALTMLVINYALTARAVAYLNHTSVWSEIRSNTSWATVQSLMLLGIAGGSLSALLRLDVGYVMGIGLLGFLILARANMSHAQALAQAQLQTLQLAAQALDARDAYTESHSERVAELAVALGKEMGLGHRTIDALRTAGSLHDIGKIGIRDHILNKAGPLTPDEWVVMRSHAARGAEMIQKHSQLAPVAPMVRSHHERYDGSGYPDGLVGLEIPLGARILAVADSFDTMTGPRIYRPSTKTPVEAIDEISTLAEKYYDPEVAAALRRIYGRYDPDPTAPSSSLQLVLSHSPFRRFLFGSAISSLGDPMTTVATLVTIYAHTKQPLMVAAAYGCKSIASLAVTSLVGAGADRAERRQLILALESARAVLLVVTPISLVLGLWVIFPLLFLLGAVNAIVQPARQAAIPQLVEPERVGQANALASAVTTAAAFVGFPLAGLVLAWTRSTDLLFIVDGVTFLVAGITVVGLGRLGGGVRGRHLWSAFRTAWTVRPARGHLVIASTSSVFIGLTFPVLIELAYELSSQGAQAYTLLEACLAGGIIVGSLLISRRSHIGTLDGVLMGLGVMGVFSIGVALSPWLWTTALLVFAASVGNPVYAIANQTAIIRAGEASNHGSLMATRFAWTQPAALVGTAVGGVIASWSNARVAYAVVGVGLLFLSMAAGLVVWRQDAELDLLRATGQDARRRSSEHKPAEMQGDIHTPNANGDSQSGATRDKDRVPISTG